MGQPGWFFCASCCGMNFPGDTNLLKEQRPGKCIAGDSFAGKHREISFEFELPFNPHDPANTGQPNWFFCNKCTSMFFASPGDDPLQVTGYATQADNTTGAAPRLISFCHTTFRARSAPVFSGAGPFAQNVRGWCSLVIQRK